MMQVEEIGHVETCFDEKFGTPRQPGLVREAWGRVVFIGKYRQKQMLEGIEGFSHLWLIVRFHDHVAEKWKPKVRPPRLGGNKSIGVWASRSPFRPNQIGLSVVKLEKVEWDTKVGPVLQISGVDFINRTPLLDIKPYVPYCDALPDAEGGFAVHKPEKLDVVFGPSVEKHRSELGAVFFTLMQDVLGNDPRPQFHDDPKRVYGVLLEGKNVRFRIIGNTCYVDDVQ